ncbi:hypothetical protein NE865_04227 [Phthorimaea operculella]|nr:hypothetical protein NE865_04227 [Phthorimaea operculella]
MRVLILPVIFAVAAAAPSGELNEAAPLAVLPVVTPTIDPGDIQAAAINAQVAAEDQARAAADKIVEENNEKVIESDSLVKEKTEENFWSVEDKKWQALDAVQTAAAKIDGAVASNADAIARSALGGVIVPTFVAPSLLPAPVVRAPIVPGAPFIPPGLPLYTAPVISPITPLLYNPALIAKKEDEKEKLIKTAEPEKDKKDETKFEEKKEEKPLEKADKDKLEKPLSPLVPLAPQPLGPWPLSPVAPVYVPQQVLAQW